MARASMGVRGANLPALVRGTVAIFWYGAQTYIASTAVALLIGTFVAADGGATVLGMTAVGWVSFVIVWSFQMVLFWNGIDWIRVFLNWAAPAVYAVMIALLLILWAKAGSIFRRDLISGIGTNRARPSFSGSEKGPSPTAAQHLSQKVTYGITPAEGVTFTN